MIAGAALFGPLVGAVATLGGVLVAQRASKKRERESRLWDMRVDAYRDITKWLLNTKVSLHGQGYVSGEALSAENVTSFQSLLKSLLPSDDLTARVTISASDRIEVVFTSSTQTMTRLTYDTFKYCTKNFGTFLFQISRLRESVRSEMAFTDTSRAKRGRKWTAYRSRLFAFRHPGREEVWYKPSADLDD